MRLPVCRTFTPRPALERAGYLGSVRVAYRDTVGEDYTVLCAEDFREEFSLA